MRTEPKITGVQISYYFICHRKLWLFKHNIKMEYEDQNVQIGKHLHEDRYPRDKKNVSILNTINVDFVKIGDEIIIHEIKKSKKMEKAHEYQLYFYLDFLRRHGVDAKGEINYPLLRRTQSLELNDDIIHELENIYDEIHEIVTGSLPPVEKKKICKKCAYYEFCFGDEGDIE